MIDKTTIQFLKELKANNERAWFQAHQAEYKAARSDMVAQVDELIDAIIVFDQSVIEQEASKCLFRINRDVRFSNDKSPYKTNFGAFITDRGRKVTRAGYYLHIEPGSCLIAGGIYMPPIGELKAIRKAIDRDAEPLREILKAAPFVQAFGEELPGERLKTAPRDYPKDHPDIDLLRLKSFEILHAVSDRDVTGKRFTDDAAALFETMAAYNGWLNRALGA